MRFTVGDKTFEIGSGHEVRELYVLYRRDRSIRAVELITETGSTHILASSNGVVIGGPSGKAGELPVGVYDVTK